AAADDRVAGQLCGGVLHVRLFRHHVLELIDEVVEIPGRAIEKEFERRPIINPSGAGRGRRRADDQDRETEAGPHAGRRLYYPTRKERLPCPNAQHSFSPSPSLPPAAYRFPSLHSGPRRRSRPPPRCLTSPNASTGSTRSRKTSA